MEKHLIQHCSPTLAGIKTANLFSYTFLSGEALTDSLAAANKTLNPKGIYAEILRIRGNNALIFVYRESKLNADFRKNGAREFLSGYGYQSDSIESFIDHLKTRFALCGGFPHEIGLFLGYPLPDVIGFIENKGKNSKCTGYWKVYCNECEAMRLFAKYEKCKSIYTRLFLHGKPIGRLIVAA